MVVPKSSNGLDKIQDQYDVVATVHFKKLRFNIYMPKMGCRVNPPTGRCAQYDGPDSDECYKGKNRCQFQRSATRPALVKKQRTPKQLANDARLGAMAKARALAKKSQKGGAGDGASMTFNYSEEDDIHVYTLNYVTGQLEFEIIFTLFDIDADSLADSLADLRNVINGIDRSIFSTDEAHVGVDDTQVFFGDVDDKLSFKLPHSSAVDALNQFHDSLSLLL